MPKEILLVANKTAGGSALQNHVRRLMQEDCHFTLLVPATPPDEHATWNDEEVIAHARERCTEAVQAFAAMGADIEGRVGDMNPYEAIGDVLREKHIDHIVLSTLPPGISKWLHRDLPARIERNYSVPLTTIIGAQDVAHA